MLASNEYFQRSGNLIPAWVNSLYTNLLSREGDSGGVSGFVQAIIAAETPARSAIANALQLSGEYRSHLVAGYYNQYLFRQPVGAEAAVWINALQSGATDEQVMTGFVTSGEYFQKHGGTNTTYINALYQDLLGRARDPNDMGFLNGLNNGTFTRSQVVMRHPGQLRVPPTSGCGRLPPILGPQSLQCRNCGQTGTLRSGRHRRAGGSAIHRLRRVLPETPLALTYRMLARRRQRGRQFPLACASGQHADSGTVI